LPILIAFLLDLYESVSNVQSTSKPGLSYGYFYKHTTPEVGLPKEQPSNAEPEPPGSQVWPVQQVTLAHRVFERQTGQRQGLSCNPYPKEGVCDSLPLEVLSFLMLSFFKLHLGALFLKRASLKPRHFNA